MPRPAFSSLLLLTVVAVGAATGLGACGASDGSSAGAPAKAHVLRRDPGAGTAAVPPALQKDLRRLLERVDLSDGLSDDLPLRSGRPLCFREGTRSGCVPTCRRLIARAGRPAARQGTRDCSTPRAARPRYVPLGRVSPISSRDGDARRTSPSPSA